MSNGISDIRHNHCFMSTRQFCNIVPIHSLSAICIKRYRLKLSPRWLQSFTISSYLHSCRVCTEQFQNFPQVGFDVAVQLPVPVSWQTPRNSRCIQLSARQFMTQKVKTKAQHEDPGESPHSLHLHRCEECRHTSSPGRPRNPGGKSCRL